MIEQIADAASQQSEAADRISIDIESVVSVTNETNAVAQLIAGTSEEIAGLASSLQKVVSSSPYPLSPRFQLPFLGLRFQTTMKMIPILIFPRI